jgi:hypothetical protein
MSTDDVLSVEQAEKLAACEVESCSRKPVGRGYCNAHWKRWRNTGDPGRATVGPLPPEERFDRFVDRSGDCWIWTGSRKSTGYGAISVNGRGYPAHRWAYEQVHGPIPGGLQIDHLCRTRLCVRVEHLELVTPAENTRRGVGPSAQNVGKTHCPKGHAYTPDNTYTDRRGKRSCRECKRIRDRHRDRSKGGQT